MINYGSIIENVRSVGAFPWFMKKTLDCLGARSWNSPGRVLPIGVTGLAGSGKDTAIEFPTTFLTTLDIYDRNYVTRKPCPGCNIDSMKEEARHLKCPVQPFAAPLKEIAQKVGFTHDQVYDPKLKNEVDPFWGISPRQFLQMCGTEMFRKVWRDDVWVELARKSIYQLRDLTTTDVLDTYIVFIPDVRFPNEAEMIKEEGGIVVRVSRPGTIEMNHDSENQIKTLEVDLDLVNDCKTPESWTVRFTSELCKLIDPKVYN